VRRLVHRPAWEQGGFSLAEVVVALMLLELVAAGLVGLLTSATAATRLARQRTLAQQAALSQIESIRGLAYDSIGTGNGNPPGAVPSTARVSTAGLDATVTTQVSYVDDPTPLSYTSHANYKKVVVTVRRAADGRELAKEVTYVAPPVKSPASNAVINAQVVDYGNNTPVPNVEVVLTKGPSPSRTDTTDVEGTVSFAGLKPNPPNGAQAYYDLSLTPPTGYVALPDTVSPALAAHVQLSPGQTWSTALFLYQPSTIVVRLNNADSTAFTGTATVTVGYTRNATQNSQAFAYTGSPLTVTSINGVPLIPGLQYTVTLSGATGFYPNPPNASPATANVPDDYPTLNTHTFAFTGAQLASAVDVTVRGANGVDCKNANVTISGGPWAVSLVGATSGTGAPAAFGGAVPAATAYTIRGAWSSYSGQLTGQTITTGTNAFTVLLGAGSSC
jgi:type II secretory pathway pseudopilin PulG